MPASCVRAQLQLGWTLDPHAGISAAFLQPAATADIPYNWDLSLGAAAAFIHTDYAYVEGASALGLLRGLRGPGPIGYDPDALGFRLGDRVYRFDYAQHGRRQFGSAGVDVLGPALSVQVGEFTRVGAFVRTRALTSMRRLDQDFNFYTNERIPNGTTFTVDESYFAAAAWSEIGLNLSRAFYVGGDAELRLGANLRYLLAHEGLSFYQPAGGTILKTGGDSTVVANGDVTLALSGGVLGEEFRGRPVGTGFGADLGIQYAWASRAEGGYQYLFGLSVLDLGRIGFGGVGAEVHRFERAAPTLLDLDDYPFDGDTPLRDGLRQLSRDAYDGDPQRSLDGQDFSVGLPATISAQFVWRPLAPFQLAAAYTGDLPFGVRQLSRGERLLLAGHYSKRWYGGGLTASLRDWRTFNLGLQLRAGPVFVGSDDLIGTVFPAARLFGGGLYFGLRWHSWPRRRAKKSGGKGWKAPKSKGKNVRCYGF